MAAHDPIEEEVGKILKCKTKDVKQSVKRLVDDIDELYDRIHRLQAAIDRCEKRKTENK